MIMGYKIMINTVYTLHVYTKRAGLTENESRTCVVHRRLTGVATDVAARLGGVAGWSRQILHKEDVEDALNLTATTGALR